MATKRKTRKTQKKWQPTLCVHELKPGTGREQEDYDYDTNDPRIIFNVECAKCGMSGSVVVYSKSDDVLWGE